MSTALDWLKRQSRRDESPVALLHRLRAQRPVPSPRPFAADRRLLGDEVAPGLWKQVTFRPWPRLAPTFDLDRFGIGLGRVDATRLCFFDTETTGLAGGTGTRAFMIGFARPSEDGLTLTQYTLATLGAERAMLQAFLHDLGESPVLVSYNGKSYDRPLLSTRLRLARLHDPLPALPHLDLLHPTRRLLKEQLPNCRLATVEREWLGIVREHDLPGSEAPAAWLSFLKGGSAALLRRVGEHNAQDLVSLAALLAKQVGFNP